GPITSPVANSEVAMIAEYARQYDPDNGLTINEYAMVSGLEPHQRQLLRTAVRRLIWENRKCHWRG
ncbi:MAG: hypothetical protein ABI878_13920, partial [Acidobacteriota bacterium]